jgi:hypothetical protein
VRFCSGRFAATGIPYRIEAYASSAFARGMSYWDWSLNPISDADGHVIHLLLTLIDVTTRVLAQQQAEQARATLAQTSLALEIEQRRLALLETLTQRIGGLLQPEDIAHNALDILQTSLHPLVSFLYAHDTAHQSFRALALTLTDTNLSWQRRLTHLSYNRSSLLLQALQGQQTLLRSEADGNENGQRSEIFLQTISWGWYYCVSLFVEQREMRGCADHCFCTDPPGGCSSGSDCRRHSLFVGRSPC